jgi:hypothetical protein
MGNDEVTRIARLYAIEAEIRDSSAKERRAARQTQTRPLVDALRALLDHQLEHVPGRSPIAEAMRYGTSHWQGLRRITVASRSTPTQSNAPFDRQQRQKGTPIGRSAPR